jgi:hypothetical protein
MGDGLSNGLSGQEGSNEGADSVPERHSRRSGTTETCRIRQQIGWHGMMFDVWPTRQPGLPRDDRKDPNIISA